MSAGVQPWGINPVEAADPEQILSEIPHLRQQTASTPGFRPLRRDDTLCTFCWAVLSPQHEDCPACGQSIAEMRALQSKMKARDSHWRPGVTSGESRRPALAYRSAPQSPAAMVARRRRARLLRSFAFVGLSSAVGGAAATAILFSLIQGQKSTPAGQAAAPTAARAAAASVQPNDGSRLAWRNLDPELRLRLLDNQGRVVADSTQPVAGVSLNPGQYTLEVREVSGDWVVRPGPVSARAGEPLVVTLPRDVTAAHYLWKGKKAHEAGDLARAEKAWRAALGADPNLHEARLQLAGLMAVQFRYADARKQVNTVLDTSPDDERARRLLVLLQQLEQRE